LISTTVDGAQVGDLASISMNTQGILSAVFKNGISENKYQLPVGTVPNPNALTAGNGNVYVVTSASGDLTQADAGSNGAGLFAPSSLESSTVDLAHEFAKMILAQRSFSAAARIVTTSDVGRTDPHQTIVSRFLVLFRPSHSLGRFRLTLAFS
jgi:flagellar hook protein FlgE